jgi:glucose-1-phosphate thymidylyltransferase
MTAGWKGVIAAGGIGSRLHPMTQAFNKHLLPVYDKPMIYYPLTTLMLGGIRDILVISTPEALPQFEKLMGDGSQWGLTIGYLPQERPNGIAECLRIAAPSIKGRSVAFMLADNIFFGAGLGRLISTAAERNDGASVFAYEVADPGAFGIITLDADGRPLSIVEKPEEPASKLVVVGLYLYGPDVADIARTLSPSGRGELEITDINRAYLDQGRLQVYPLGRGFAWLDGGTPNDLFEASQFIKVMEARTGLKIGCPEEVAFRMGYITLDILETSARRLPAGDYATYLLSIAAGERRQRVRPSSANKKDA